MKTLLSISMLFGLLWILGCKPVEEPVPVPEIIYGKASCDFDGVKWYGVVEPIPFNGIQPNYVQIFKTTTGQYIHFSNIHLALGKIPLNDSIPYEFKPQLADVSYTGSSFSDAIEFYFEPMRLDSIENYFEITSLDEKSVQGNFQCVFAKKSVAQIDSLSAIPVDTIYILNGKFETPRTQ